MKRTVTMGLLRFNILLFSVGCSCQNEKHGDKIVRDQPSQEAIIEKYATNCAHNYNYYLPEWQECLNAGLQKDSTIAYLWQQKAMPYFKQKKYEAGFQHLQKAVLYDRKRYLPYSAFINCIFARRYGQAIAEFEQCIKLNGNSYEMDHTYRFYIALSYLQLNKFSEAEKVFKEDIADQSQKYGEAHYLDRFYYGIALYEQKRWVDAIAQFDVSLIVYTEFSEARYYKSLCLARLGQLKQSDILMKEAASYAKSGYSINEDNAIYEDYPYKVAWKTIGF